MRRRTGRDSSVARASREYRRTRGTNKATFCKRHAVEWLENRVLLSATPTTIAVSASSSSVVYGQAVTLTADVSASPSAPSEGSVVFFDNGTALAMAPVSSGGVATLADVRLPAGADLITASYIDPSGAFASSSTAVGPNSTIETVAGGGLQDGLPAVDASISPQAVAVDSSGDLFIADDALNVVFEVNHATGVATIVAGNGTPGFSGDGGAATEAELSGPTGVAVDSSGRLFIADSYNNRIRQVDLATGIITTVAGNGAPGFGGDGGQATATELAGPAGVAVDSSGDLFIVDKFNSRIRQVDLATGIITTVAGNGTHGFSGDGGQATAAELAWPKSIAVDSSGDLFIADSDNYRIREVDHATGVIATVVGNGTDGISGDGGQATAAEVGGSVRLAVDSSGDLFIADRWTSRIREVDHASGVIATVAGGGKGGIGDNGLAAAAEFNSPYGVAVDSSGDLFIADSGNYRVREVSHATGIVATVAGKGTRAFSGDGGLATAAEVDSPHNIAVDSSGDLFIADAPNNRIREVNHATGVITTVAGNGTSGFSGDGGPAAAAELNSPLGVVVDSSGDLFVADSGNNRIREVNHATGIITTVAGNGSQGFSGDGGPAIAAELSYPTGLAVDSSHDLFIAGNNRIRQVDLGTGVITTVAGNGTAGFSGDGGPATAAELSEPHGIAVDSSRHLFIADEFNGRIREVNLATGVITTVAGNGTQAFSGDGGAASAAELAMPDGVAVDSSGDLFIADWGNDRIREVDSATGVITTVAGNGVAGFGGDGGPAIAAEFAFLDGVAVDSSGDLFIADGPNNRVREVTSSTAIGPRSTIETVAGGGLQNGLPAVDASLSPQAVAVDSSGNLFIADNALNVVFEVNHTTGVATIVAGNGTAGFSGDGGAATAAELNAPEGLAVDSSGDLFIADSSNNRIREVDLATGVISTLAGSGVAGQGYGFFGGDGGPANAAQLAFPNDVAVDSLGNLFIAANGRIREVDHATGIITTVAGNGTSGFSGDGGPATAAEFYDVEGVAVDSSGDLFIADGGNNRIREVNHATGLITTVAGNGTAGFSGDGGQATSADLHGPSGVAADSSGEVFITDLINNCIREVDHATGVITTVAGGTFGFSGDGGPATAGELAFPRGVAVDSSGDLFVADSGNNRVREVNHATHVITTVAGNGTQAFSGDGALATAAEVDSPKNIAVDSSGDLFIADSSNNRVREVNHATGVITTVAGNGTAGFGGDLGPATAAELHDPEGIAVNSSGDLFIADALNRRIREVDLTTGVITTFAGNGIYGFSGDGGTATGAELSYPEGIVVDSSGNLFIADSSNNRIREINHSTGIITTVAGNGAAGFSGDGGPAAAAEFNGPNGIAVDSSGDLFIVDEFNFRVRKVNLATGVVTTVAGNGSGGFSGDGGPATAAELSVPDGISVDSSGHMFIADRGNKRVREVDLATGIITTVAGNGAFGFSGDGGPAATEIGFAEGVAVDSSGDLFIADGSNNRIREVSSGAAVINVTQPLVVNNAVYTIGSGIVSVSAADGLLQSYSTSPEKFTVTAGTVAGAEGGSFVFHADGSFTYTPPAKFPGFDYAQFTVTSVQGDQGTATVNVLSQTGGVVWKFYEQVLDRAPDYGGLQFWINDLSSGGKPGDIAAGFFESDELLDQIVANYYQQYLLRTPDASGLAYWKQVWRESGGPETIKAGFADSPEFYASAGGTAQAWVTELYHRILGRDPDPQGDQFWLNYLTSHGNTAATRYNIALDFFTSLETDKADVTGWFQEYLERAPTASELDQYAGEMQAGKTDRDIEQEIANLPEYGQNPPAAPAGVGVRLPDYFPH